MFERSSISSNDIFSWNVVTTIFDSHCNPFDVLHYGEHILEDHF